MSLAILIISDFIYEVLNIYSYIYLSFINFLAFPQFLLHISFSIDNYIHISFIIISNHDLIIFLKTILFLIFYYNFYLSKSPLYSK